MKSVQERMDRVAMKLVAASERRKLKLPAVEKIISKFERLEATSALFRLANDAPSEIGERATSALGNLKIVGYLISLIRYPPSPEIKQRAVEELEKMIPELIRNKRIEALGLFAQYVSPKSSEKIISALEDLGAESELIHLLRWVPEVREPVSIVLGKKIPEYIKRREIDKLKLLAERAPLEIRKEAIFALRDLRAVEALLDLARWTSPEVGKLARSALDAL